MPQHPPFENHMWNDHQAPLNGNWFRKLRPLREPRLLRCGKVVKKTSILCPPPPSLNILTSPIFFQIKLEDPTPFVPKWLSYPHSFMSQKRSNVYLFSLCRNFCQKIWCAKKNPTSTKPINIWSWQFDIFWDIKLRGTWQSFWDRGNIILIMCQVKHNACLTTNL
jgi:hypothetical protein